MESKGSKVIVTIVTIIIFIVIFAIIVGVRTDAGYSGPGILGLIVGAALIGALSALWKKKGGDNNSNK